MAIFGLLTKSEAREMTATEVANFLQSKKGKQLVTQLQIESLDRAKADVAGWRLALEAWEEELFDFPDRYLMIQLYKEIENDDDIATHFDTICKRIEGAAFEVGTKTGEKFNPDIDKTELFKDTWFEKVIRLIVESEMQGFTLVDVFKPTGEIYDDDCFQLVPREYVIPELEKVRKRQQVNIDLIDMNAPEFAPRLMRIGDKKAKGLFNNMALLYIYKKNALAFWSNYQSKFGIPPVIAKTDLNNKTKVDSIVDFLSKMRQNTFSIVGIDDEIQILNGVDTDAFKTFQEMINHCGKQMSKVMEGQTMTSNDGSSRSQAEVHQDTSNEFHLARLRRVERIINKHLVPIMIQDGFLAKGDKFRFKELKDIDAIIERLVKLKQAGFTMSAEDASELTGYTLVEVQAPTPTGGQSQPQSIMNAIDELYKDVIKCC